MQDSFESRQGAVGGTSQQVSPTPSPRRPRGIYWDITQSNLPIVRIDRLRPREGEKLARGPTESLKQPGVQSRLLVSTSALHPWLKKA